MSVRESGPPASGVPPAQLGRVLVVDDEPAITELLESMLAFEGYDVDVAATGIAALTNAIGSSYDVIVLDVMLPDIEGVDVCRRLRASGIATPVLFLTARDATEDKVVGLTSGGDDYVTKPFSMEELLARVTAIIRRSNQERVPSERITVEDLVMDLGTFEVWRQGRPVELTPTEFSLLSYLAENARHVLSKSQILDQVWEQDCDDPNVVETYISYLRKKIDCFEPPLIQTVRGVGYTLRLPRSP